MRKNPITFAEWLVMTPQLKHYYRKKRPELLINISENMIYTRYVYSASNR